MVNRSIDKKTVLRGTFIFCVFYRSKYQFCNGNTAIYTSGCGTNPTTSPPINSCYGKSGTVKSGDTCYSIATTICDVTLASFEQANGLTASSCKIGRNYCCPSTSCTSNKKRTIVSGDTCFAIAINYCGESLTTFFNNNPQLGTNGALCNNLKIGQVVCC